MKQSLVAFARSFVFAFSGVAHAFRTQRNMRVHILIAWVIVVLGWWLGISSVEWAIIVLTMGAVFAAEMMNTVVERMVDLISPEHHALAKAAKDVAAGAVLVLAISAVIVGVFIIVPKLMAVLAR